MYSRQRPDVCDVVSFLYSRRLLRRALPLHDSVSCGRARVTLCLRLRGFDLRGAG